MEQYNLPPTVTATEKEAALVYLATLAEAIAGIDDTKAMTPLKTAEAIAELAGKVKDLSINGKTITATFADGTTKKLTTQDNHCAPDYSSHTVLAIDETHTMVADGYLIVKTQNTASGQAGVNLTINGKIFYIEANDYSLDSTIFPVMKGDTVLVEIRNNPSTGWVRFYKRRT